MLKELYTVLPDIDLSIPFAYTRAVAKEFEAKPEIKPYVQKAYTERREEIKKNAELPAPTTDLSEYVVVSNLPVIVKDKEEQFIKVFLSIAKKLGLNIQHESITMPFKPDSKENYGCIFVKCADVKTADSVSSKLNNVKIGKNTIKTVIMADFDRAVSSVPIEEHSFSKVDLHKWMIEPIAQQYCMSVGKEIHVWWHTDPSRKTEEAIEVKMKEPIKCDNFSWSPQGTYLIAKDSDVITHTITNA